MGAPLAVARHRAHLLQVRAQQTDAVVEFVHHQHAPIGQQRETRGLAEPRLRRRAVPVPLLAVARHRAYLLQVGAEVLQLYVRVSLIIYLILVEASYTVYRPNT